MSMSSPRFLSLQIELMVDFASSVQSVWRMDSPWGASDIWMAAASTTARRVRAQPGVSPRAPWPPWRARSHDYNGDLAASCVVSSGLRLPVGKLDFRWRRMVSHTEFLVSIRSTTSRLCAATGLEHRHRPLHGGDQARAAAASRRDQSACS